jgi:hypothetical protein
MRGHSGAPPAGPSRRSAASRSQVTGTCTSRHFRCMSTWSAHQTMYCSNLLLDPLDPAWIQRRPGTAVQMSGSGKALGLGFKLFPATLPGTDLPAH